MKLFIIFYYSKADKRGYYEMAAKLVNAETLEYAYYQIIPFTIDIWVNQLMRHKTYYIVNSPLMSNISMGKFNKEFGKFECLDSSLKFKKALKDLGVIIEGKNQPSEFQQMIHDFQDFEENYSTYIEKRKEET